MVLGSHSCVALYPMTVAILYLNLPEAPSVKLQGFASQNLVLITNFFGVEPFFWTTQLWSLSFENLLTWIPIPLRCWWYWLYPQRTEGGFRAVCATGGTNGDPIRWTQCNRCFFFGSACIAAPDALGYTRSRAPVRFQSLGEKCGIAVYLTLFLWMENVQKSNQMRTI